ncbi:hypothetical protein NMY22_g12224 [Coprinellus aureogranulatus]|nr:hypothetical protein NMY22_g12224 [Coprinellus aureogranulatus]
MRFTILSSTATLALCLLSAGFSGVSATGTGDALEIRGARSMDFDVLEARMLVDALEVDLRDYDEYDSREFDDVNLLDARELSDALLEARQRAPVSGWKAFGNVLKAGAHAWVNHRASQGRQSRVSTALKFASAFNNARKGRK